MCTDIDIYGTGKIVSHDAYNYPSWGPSWLFWRGVSSMLILTMLCICLQLPRTDFNCQEPGWYLTAHKSRTSETRIRRCIATRFQSPLGLLLSMVWLICIHSARKYFQVPTDLYHRRYLWVCPHHYNTNTVHRIFVPYHWRRRTFWSSWWTRSLQLDSSLSS